MEPFIDAVTSAFAGLEWDEATASARAEVRGFPGFSVSINFTDWGREEARLIVRVRAELEAESAERLLWLITRELVVRLFEGQSECNSALFDFHPLGRFEPDDEFVAYTPFALAVEGGRWRRVRVDGRNVPFNPSYRVVLARSNQLVTSTTELIGG